jgi:hypothetical protein
MRGPYSVQIWGPGSVLIDRQPGKALRMTSGRMSRRVFAQPPFAKGIPMPSNPHATDKSYPACPPNPPLPKPAAPVKLPPVKPVPHTASVALPKGRSR